MTKKKVVKKKTEKKSAEKKTIQKNNPKKENEKTLTWVLAISIGILALVGGVYFYTQSQINFKYNGIEFKAFNEGSNEDPLIMYRTMTLLKDYQGDDFGFRVRTKPSKLKKIDFENLENYQLMKLNAYVFEGGTFNCEGNGIIAVPNMVRVFEKAGMKMLNDPNSTCDSEERYNHFTFKYGDKTKIVEVAPKCYEVIVEGNDEMCEILPATEKLMVETFIKYRDL